MAKDQFTSYIPTSRYDNTILYYTILYYILYTIYYILYRPTIYYILYYTIYYTILYYKILLGSFQNYKKPLLYVVQTQHDIHN